MKFLAFFTAAALFAGLARASPIPQDNAGPLGTIDHTIGDEGVAVSDLSGAPGQAAGDVAEGCLPICAHSQDTLNCLPVFYKHLLEDGCWSCCA